MDAWRGDAAVTTPTAADLHRWYCGPWCPEHGFVAGDCCIGTPSPSRGSLHERLPESRPERTIKIDEGGRCWLSDNGWVALPVWVAADLLTAAAVRAMALQEYTVIVSASILSATGQLVWDVELEHDHLAHVYSQAPSLAEAMAAAGHRLCDAMEGHHA